MAHRHHRADRDRSSSPASAVSPMLEQLEPRLLLSGIVELSPPYADATVTQVASPVGWLIGDAGYYSTVDTSTGRIQQYGIAYAALLGGAGVLVGDAMRGGFTVVDPGQYVVQFSGSISWLLWSVGKTVIAGGQKGAFDIEINAGVQARHILTAPQYETDLSPIAYLGEVTSSVVSGILDAAPVSGVLKIGIDVYNAVNEIQEAVPEDLAEDRQFNVSVPV